MRRTAKKHIAALLLLTVFAGSAACAHAGPVSVHATAPAETPTYTEAREADTPAPTDTPIPASSFEETYFRRAGDPPEVVINDEEHGHWEYRSDALDVRIDCVTVDLGRGNATYFVANIHVRDAAQLRDATIEPSGAYPWRLARENKAVLLLSGRVADLSDPNRALVAEGEAVTARFDQPGRGVDARTGVGMLEEGHYLAVVADGRQPGYSVGLTLSELADALLEHGAWTAYALADGRETALVFMGEQLNHHAGTYAGGDPSYQARVRAGLAFGESALVPKATDEVKNDGNGRRG